MKKWITLFSQTGTEIYNLINLLGKKPDAILTNRESFDGININLLDVAIDRIYFLQPRPTTDVYNAVLRDIGCVPENTFLTMHGYLRIIPDEICNTYEIYNLHPAPLRQHPELKGKDPQKRIASTPYTYYGNTIHKCTSELDAGEIVCEEFYPNKNYSHQEIVDLSHSSATNLWFNFLNHII